MNMKYGMDGDHVDIAGSHSMADITIVCLLCIYSSCKSKTLKHGRPNSELPEIAFESALKQACMLVSRRQIK